MGEKLTGKQRMLLAYRGQAADRPAVAPEFWYYYPAKLLGIDMIEFSRNVPFHKALKTTFAKFGCEGWGVASPLKLRSKTNLRRIFLFCFPVFFVSNPEQQTCMRAAP